MESHDRLPCLRQLQVELCKRDSGEPAGESGRLAEKQGLTGVPRTATQDWGLVISEPEGPCDYPGVFLHFGRLIVSTKCQQELDKTLAHSHTSSSPEGPWSGSGLGQKLLCNAGLLIRTSL